MISLSQFRWRMLTARSRLLNTAKIAAKAPFLYRNYLYFFYGRFQNQDGLLSMHNGLRFRIRAHSTDRASLSEVFALNTYAAVPDGAVVVDIGANIGAFTLLAARSAAIVYAIEPVASNFKALQHNLQINKASNVSSHKLAICGVAGKIEISDAGVESSAYFIPPNARTEQVKALTLEGFLEHQKIEEVDYLKMDCEGAEWDIVLNAPPSVLRRFRYIEIEFHRIGNLHPRVLEKQLADAGFRSTYTDGANFNGILRAERLAISTDQPCTTDVPTSAPDVLRLQEAVDDRHQVALDRTKATGVAQ